MANTNLTYARTIFLAAIDAKALTVSTTMWSTDPPREAAARADELAQAWLDRAGKDPLYSNPIVSGVVIYDEAAHPTLQTRVYTGPKGDGTRIYRDPVCAAQMGGTVPPGYDPLTGELRP